MRRREFITGAATWPLAARAQQPAMPVVVYLARLPPRCLRTLRGLPSGPEGDRHIEGENVVLEIHLAEGQDERLPVLARQAVRRQVSVIVTGASRAAFAAKAETATIPIVSSSVIRTSRPCRSASGWTRSGLAAAGEGWADDGLTNFVTIQVPKLISRLRSGAMLLADRGYDADWIRALVDQHGAWANIPPRPGPCS